jgi:hypothetical protein
MNEFEETNGPMLGRFDRSPDQPAPAVADMVPRESTPPHRERRRWHDRRT